MTLNRPYTFELAHSLLAARAAGQETAGHYTSAARNGVDRALLDRAADTLQLIAPPDIDAWLRGEYFVDGWLQGYLPLTATTADTTLTTWVLGQMADEFYRTH